MNTYTVKNSPDIFSTALNVYGTIEEVVKLCVDNKLTIVNTGLTPGSKLEYDSTLVVPITPVQAMQAPQPAPPLKLNYKSTYGQNQFDIALNTYGSIEQYVKMLVDNNVDNDYIPSGKTYTFDLHLIKDVNIYNATTAKKIIFSTGISTTDYILADPTGNIIEAETGEGIQADT